MLFDLSKHIDKEQAKARFEYLIEKGVLIDISEKRKKRTIQQNKYLHVLFALFGIEFGYNIEESKTLIKRELKYFYKKNEQIFLKKTSKMNTEELTIFIEKFRNYSSQNGLYLPSAEMYLLNYIDIDKEIEKHNIYL